MWSALRWVALGLAVLAGAALLVPATVGFASLLVLALLALVARLLTVPERDWGQRCCPAPLTRGAPTGLPWHGPGLRPVALTSAAGGRQWRRGADRAHREAGGNAGP